MPIVRTNDPLNLNISQQVISADRGQCTGEMSGFIRELSSSLERGRIATEASLAGLRDALGC